MNNANYVLKTNEAVLIPENESVLQRVVKIGVWIVVLIIVVGSLIFRDNLFSEISWTTRVLLIVLAVGVLFWSGRKVDTPSEMELQFYDDYFVFYLPKRYYSRRITRKDITTMKYSEISKCVYLTKSCRVQIYGNGTSVWYNYKKDGKLPDDPTETRHFTGGMIYFSTRCATGIDFKKEIEEHSPIKVIVENS